MLNKTKRQIMLWQLGYYEDKFDGIWGTNSKKATRKFQIDHNLKVDGIYGTKTNKKLESVYKEYMNGLMTDEDWKRLKYFKKSELDCNDKCGYDKVYKQLAYNIDALRYHLGTAMTVISGCRCYDRNKEAKGASGSRHYNKEKGCKAIDFTSKATNTFEKRKEAINFYIKYFPNARYSYCDGYVNNLGIKYTKKVSSMGSSVHVDVK